MSLRLGESNTSSQYSTIPSTVSSWEDNNTENDNDNISFIIPKRKVVQNYQVPNPYANSLWMGTRGDNGSGAIDEIQGRVEETNNRKNVRKLHISDDEAIRSPVKKIKTPIKDREFEKFKLFDTTNTIRSKQDSKYRKVLMELLDTEIRFRNDLRLVNTVYRSILHKSNKYKHIISQRDEAIIFSNINVMTELSELFINSVIKTIRIQFNGILIEDEPNFGQQLASLDVESLDIGDLLNTHFSRLAIPYKSYAQNHMNQLQTLQEKINTGGPKISKWLDDCTLIAKLQSDSWSLESFLIKPIQRITKYRLLIESLLETSKNSLSQDHFSTLCDARRALEKLLDNLNRDMGNEESETACGISHSKVKSSETSSLNIPERSVSRKQDYAAMVICFKKKVKKLHHFKKMLNASLLSFSKILLDHKLLIQKWRDLMTGGTAITDNHYIDSIYSSYLDKLSEEKQQTNVMVAEFKQRVMTSIDLVMECVSSIEHKLHKHRNKRAAYVNYMKHGDGNSDSSAVADAQSYIIIENEINDELPTFIDILDQLSHYVTLKYIDFTLEWLKCMSGSSRIRDYRSLLDAGELKLGDNFDIIEYYSIGKHNTNMALRSLYSAPFDQALSSMSDYGTDLRVSNSKVVRRLFSI